MLPTSLSLIFLFLYFLFINLFLFLPFIVSLPYLSLSLFAFLIFLPTSPFSLLPSYLFYSFISIRMYIITFKSSTIMSGVGSLLATVCMSSARKACSPLQIEFLSTKIWKIEFLCENYKKKPSIFSSLLVMTVSYKKNFFKSSDY
jgi:hypothetical protein